MAHTKNIGGGGNIFQLRGGPLPPGFHVAFGNADDDGNTPVDRSRDQIAESTARKNQEASRTKCAISNSCDRTLVWWI
jgi:hypothetical protein